MFLTIGAVNRYKKEKKIMQTIIFLLFSNFFNIYQLFLFGKVKRSVIINYKHGIYN